MLLEFMESVHSMMILYLRIALKVKDLEALTLAALKPRVLANLLQEQEEPMLLMIGIEFLNDVCDQISLAFESLVLL